MCVNLDIFLSFKRMFALLIIFRCTCFRKGPVLEWLCQTVQPRARKGNVAGREAGAGGLCMPH